MCRRNYNPDICFVSRNNQDLPIPAYRKVLNKFPNSQHKPVTLSVRIQIIVIRTANLKRWNFRRANWTMFQKEVDSDILHLQATVGNYKNSVNILHEAATKSILRGYRREFIPGWTRHRRTQKTVR
ncbi:hypothetical protein JTB14_012375 [Gonioctena quinquepunctata]|nr:hypothetical protein JTB14_012375 [Gonioctena quinquepunctata]